MLKKQCQFFHERSRVEKVVILSLVVLLCIEILYLIRFNFIYSFNAMDQDAAKLMIHMVEIVRSGHVLIPGWRYMTTHEIDSAMLLAIPVYAITADVPISFAVSNSTYIVVLLFVILKLFRNLDIDLQYALTACCIVFIPYRFGMLEYFNMMFIRGGQYSIKVLIPLLAMVLLTFPDRKPFRDYTISGIWMFLVFVCSFSSGLFPVVTGIFPIVIMYIFKAVSDGKKIEFFRWRTILLFLGFVVSLFGFFIHQVYDISPSGINATVTTSREFAERIHINISYYLNLINALPSTDPYHLEVVREINVVSIEGMGYVIRFFLASVLLIISFGYGLKMFGNHDGYASKSWDYIEYSLSIIVINVVIHLLCSYDTPRYYIVEFIFMIILGAVYLSNTVESLRIGGRSLLWACIVLSLIFVWYTSKQVIQKDLVSRDYYSYCSELCDFFREQNVNNVIILDNSETEEICRILLPDQKFSNYSSPDGQFMSYDWYSSTNDASYYGDSSIIATMYYEDISSVFGPECGKNYTYLGDVAGFRMFRTDIYCLPLGR